MPINPTSPKILLEGPRGLISLCQDVNFKIIQVKDDGKRGLIHINWKLISGTN